MSDDHLLIRTGAARWLSDETRDLMRDLTTREVARMRESAGIWRSLSILGPDGKPARTATLTGGFTVNARLPQRFRKDPE